MESDKKSISSGSVGWFIFGSLVGVGVAVLLAPEAGKYTRRRLARQASFRGKNLFESSQDVFEKGRELFERGREIAQEASEMFERGRRIAEKEFDERI